MQWNDRKTDYLKIVPSDTLSKIIKHETNEEAFIDIFVTDFESESFCILTEEQTRELVDYLLGLLGEKVNG